MTVDIRCKDEQIVQMLCRWFGPLRINGDYTNNKEYDIPLMTHEKTVFISVNRGIKVLNMCGGADVYVKSSCMTRAPLMLAASEKQADEMRTYVLEHQDKLSEIADSTTRYGRTLSVGAVAVELGVYIRTMMDPRDAAGHNMTGEAASAVCEHLEQIFEGSRYASLSSNYDTDKKPSEVNYLQGRGKRTYGKVIVPKGIVQEHLHTTPERVAELNYYKNEVGSDLAGTVGGYNSHYSNIVSAMYLATGQDLANGVEGSMGETVAKVTDGGDLFFSVSPSNLIVGTVGGGTCTDFAAANLERLGCLGGAENPGDNGRKLAEIITAAILAGELSTMCELTNPRRFIDSHKRIERT